MSVLNSSPVGNIRKAQCVIVLLIVSLLGNGQPLKPEVGLRNDVVLFPETIQHKERGSPSSHLLLNSEDRVSIKLVSYYQTTSDFYLIHRFDDVGYVEMRRTETGPISIFEFSKDTYDPYWVGGGKFSNNYEFYLFNNELKPLNHANLKLDLKDDEQSMLMINRKVRNNFIRAGVFTGGLILAAYGVGKMFVPDENGVSRFEFTPNLPFIVGVPVMVLSITFGRKDQLSLTEIVKRYNLQNR